MARGKVACSVLMISKELSVRPAVLGDSRTSSRHPEDDPCKPDGLNGRDVPMGSAVHAAGVHARCLQVQKCHPSILKAAKYTQQWFK